MALTLSGEAKTGAGLLHEAVEVAEASEELADDPRLLAWAALGPLCLREAGAGRELVGRALDLVRARAAIGVLPYLLSHVAIDLATTDRWAEAEAAFHEVIGLARETNQMTDLAAALSRLAWLEARQGHEQQSRAHAGEAIKLADELGLRLIKLWATAALGEVELARGAPPRPLPVSNSKKSSGANAVYPTLTFHPAPSWSSFTSVWASASRPSRRQRRSKQKRKPRAAVGHSPRRPVPRASG